MVCSAFQYCEYAAYYQYIQRESETLAMEVDIRKEMSREEIKELIQIREVREIMFQDELKNKVLIYDEDKMESDGSFDLIYYYINRKESLRDPETVIYVDTVSKRKARERSIREFEKRRKAV